MTSHSDLGEVAKPARDDPTKPSDQVESILADRGVVGHDEHIFEEALEWLGQGLGADKRRVDAERLAQLDLNPLECFEHIALGLVFKELRAYRDRARIVGLVDDSRRARVDRVQPLEPPRIEAGEPLGERCDLADLGQRRAAGRTNKLDGEAQLRLEPLRDERCDRVDGVFLRLAELRALTFEQLERGAGQRPRVDVEPAFDRESAKTRGSPSESERVTRSGRTRAERERNREVVELVGRRDGTPRERFAGAALRTRRAGTGLQWPR